MPTKILITDGLANDGLDILKSEKSFELDVRKATDAAELLKLIPGYDCLVVRSATKVTREVIEKGTQLKLICRAGAGVDNVDVEAATRKKITVMNTASANSQAAAEQAIALMFAALRQVPQAHESMKAGRWDRANFTGLEATGKTLGVLGLGNIGRIVADRAIGLRMKVVGYDPLVKNPSQLPAEIRDKVAMRNSIEEVLKEADIVTLHLPLIKETKGLFNRDRLMQMKDGAFLINCARGGLVDEDAVADLLSSGKLRGAAFDVFAEEPVKSPSKLVQNAKAIVTPHLGASTAEAQLRVGITAAQQMVGFFTRGERTGVLN
ncbi:MAG: hydroxyacid dehydrogenase [Deltaproteobacteria bacterium]|nr:hydroxyacid dehydrogenase [Deltaproteobacteria bacterium]